jgi:hypothetical protein
LSQLGYASDILFLVALYLSKCCVVLFFKRISPARHIAIFAWTVLGICIAFAIASIFIVSLRCDLSRPWIVYGGTCSGLLERWYAAIALDMASEVALFAMSVYLVWDLQTSFDRKARVVFAFALRLLWVQFARGVLLCR